MDFEIVASPHYLELPQLIAKHVGKQVIVPEIIRFADSEVKISFVAPDQLTNKLVFAIQSTSIPVHDNLMQFLLMAHKVKAAGATKIIGIMPYVGYSRHDDDTGSLKLIADLIKTAGVHELITIDFHASDINTFFSIPVHNITSLDIIADHAKTNLHIADACVVSPDKGSQAMAQALSRKLDVPCILFAKERYDTNTVRIIDNNQSIHAKTAIIIDDIIDTGNTALNVCKLLHQKGVERIFGYFVHPVLSHDAAQSIEHSFFDTVFVSNSIILEEQAENIKQFDISFLIEQKIKELAT